MHLMRRVRTQVDMCHAQMPLLVLPRFFHMIPVRLFCVDKGAAYVEFPLVECDMEAWLEQEALTGCRGFSMAC